MKSLNKRLTRDFKANLGRYCALAIMIILGIYVVVSVAGMSEITIQGSRIYNDECNLQDGQFTTFIPMTENQIQELENRYGDIEEEFYFDIEAEDKVLRIFKSRSRINTLKLCEGNKASENNEIVIMNLFADRNRIKVGDEIIIGGRHMIVSGTGCVPDYNLPVKNFTDMTADPETFGVAFVSDVTFDELAKINEASGMVYTYAYSLREGVDHQDLKEEISELTKIENFYDNADNPRIASDAASDVILKKYISMVAGALLVMLFAFVISVFVVHQINEESSVIGTLYAMGIRQNTLIAHYIILPVLVTFFAGIIGMVLGFSKIGIDFQMQDSYMYYSIPQMKKIYPAYIIAYCIVVPPLIAAAVNILAIRKKLSGTALSLIKNEQESLIGRTGKKSNEKDSHFLRSFALKQFSREKRSVITVLAGMFLSLLIFMIGLNCFVLCNNVKKNNINDINYENMYLLKYPVEKVPEDSESFFIKNLSVNYLDYSLDVNIIGIGENSSFYPFETKKNKKDIVIASSTAEKYNLKIGDTMILDDTANSVKYAFVVVDIVPYSIGLTAYMDINEMRRLFDVPEDYYNMLLSDKELNLDKEGVLSVTKRSEVINAAGIFVDQMMPLIIILITVSVIIFIAVTYLMSGVMIDRSRFSISLVKIFGYRMREIRRVYQNGNYLVVLLGSIIMLPIAKVIADKLYPFMIANTAMGMDLEFEWYIYPGILAGIMLIYYIISVVLSGKIYKIVPAEVLKNRE